MVGTDLSALLWSPFGSFEQLAAVSKKGGRGQTSKEFIGGVRGAEKDFPLIDFPCWG